MHGALQRRLSRPAVPLHGMNAATCRSRSAAASILALLLCLIAAPAHAFTQRDLATLHDSLQRIDDPSLLRGMIAQRQRAARSAELLTERGLIGLRLFAITSARTDGKTAQKSFEDALRVEPNYGWAHYGLGMVLTDGPGSNPFAKGWRNKFVLDDAIARVFGNDAPARARRAFLSAVNGQPPVPQAAAELADIATVRWNRDHLEMSATALAQLNNSVHASGESWLAFARVQLELGDVDAAVTSIERATSLGVSRASGARTLALILFQSERREQEGAAAWFESLEHADSALIKLLFDDVSAVLSKTEIERFEKLELDAKRNYLRSFWDVRAALGGVPVHERLAEHYRRVIIARRHYWRSARFGAPAGNQLLLRSFGDRPYDDRGMIFIRHGQPQRILRSSGPDTGRESWVYQGTDGEERMLHFAAMQSNSDYDLVHLLPCDADYLDPRRSGDPVLARLAMRCRPTDQMAASAEYRQYAFAYVGSDSDRPNFTKDLPFYFDLYTFRGIEGRTNVVAAVAVPVERLQKTVAALSPSYRVDLSLILVDTASRRVVRQDDSVALATTRAFKNDDLFRMHVEVAVPPSRTTLQRVIVSDPSEPGIGQLYGGPFPIPDYSVGKLMMSDIVLAEPRVDGRWRRGNVALALVPTGRFKGGSFRVFYEIYNIEKNSAYTTEIEIEPVQRSAGQRIKELFGSKSKISLKFDGVALDVQDGVLQELRQVEAPLSPGRYRMRISVRDANGELVKGERLFVVPD
jgi:GWxTD domain-containing protein